MLVLEVPCTHDHAVICIIKVHSNDCNLCKHSQCNIKSVSTKKTQNIVTQYTKIGAASLSEDEKKTTETVYSTATIRVYI